MPDTADALLAEMAIEKYAEAKGLDVKEVKKKWLPILQAEKTKDPFTESLIDACSILGQIKEVGKGLDPETQMMLGKLSSVAVTRALNPEQGGEKDEDEKLYGVIRRLKILDHAFTDPDEVYEKIAEKVSQEVSTPLAQALEGLRETLAKITPEVKAEPEIVRNPELVDLSQTLENINTTMVHLAERIEKGAPKGEIETDVESMVARVEDATQKSRSFLEKQGFKIVVEDAPATLEEAQKIVESHGYTLQDQRVSRDEAQKMADAAAEAERKKHDNDLELRLEEKKIEAAKEITATAIDKVMEPFSYFLRQYLGTAMGEEVSIPDVNTPAQPPQAKTPATSKPAAKPKAKVKSKSGTGKP